MEVGNLLRTAGRSPDGGSAATVNDAGQHQLGPQGPAPCFYALSPLLPLLRFYSFYAFPECQHGIFYVWGAAPEGRLAGPLTMMRTGLIVYYLIAHGRSKLLPLFSRSSPAEAGSESCGAMSDSRAS